MLTNPGEKIRTFVETIRVFLAFLLHAGINKELAKAFVTPRLATNMLLTARIQASFGDHRRTDCAFTNAPINEDEKLRLLQEAERYLSFSTAAYGTFQIFASESLHVETALATVDSFVSRFQTVPVELIQRLRTRRIAKYLDISQDQILYLTPPAGNSSLVRHFVAVDHNTRSVYWPFVERIPRPTPLPMWMPLLVRKIHLSRYL